MKKLSLLAMIAVFSASIGLSQNILISFEDFEKAISNVNIQGFTIIPNMGDEDLNDEDDYYGNEHGDYAETEYSISFMNNSGGVLIFTMYLRTDEPTWTGTAYIFEAVKVEYAEFRDMKMFNADLKFINAVLTINSTGNHNKSEMESIFKSSGLANMKPATLNWPSEIPAQYRLKGTIIDITKSETGTEFKSLISVTAQMDETLNESYKSLLNTYGEGESFINLPNGIIFSPPFGDVVEDLYDKKNDGELLKFQYHIP